MTAAASEEGVRRNQELTVGICVTCLALSLFSYIARIYARSISTAKLWYDDYWMGGVLFVCIGLSIGDFIGLKYGSGQHQEELDVETLTKFQQNLYVYMLFWATGVFSVKVGILLFYWRVFTTPNFRKWIIGAFAISTGIFLGNFFSFLLQCLPIKRFWIPDLEGGECFNQDMFYEASAIINVIGDVIVLLLPLPVVWGLNTSGRKKWALSFLFLLGAFVCVASIFRIIAVLEINPEDFTFSNVAGGIWSTVEVELGFICANLPAVRPLITRCLGKGDGSRTGASGYGQSHTGSRSAANHFRSRQHDGFELMDKDNNSDTATLVKGPSVGGAPSDRSIPRGNIQVRTDVDISDEEWSNGQSKKGTTAQVASLSPV